MRVTNCDMSDGRALLTHVQAVQSRSTIETIVDEERKVMPE
jgi:hypothetical protein